MENNTLPPRNRLYKEFLINRKNSIFQDITTLQTELREIDEELLHIDHFKPVMNGVKKDTSNDEIVVLPNGYIPKWSYPKKIEFILKLKGKPLTARQITDVIMEDIEVDTWIHQTKKEKDKVYSTISSTLTNNSKEGKDFVKSQNSIGENIYDLAKKISPKVEA